MAVLFVANAFLILFSVQINPITSFIGLYVLFDPYFKRREKELKENILKTIVNDDRLYFLCKAKPNYELIGKKDAEVPVEPEGPQD